MTDKKQKKKVARREVHSRKELTDIKNNLLGSQKVRAALQRHERATVVSKKDKNMSADKVLYKASALGPTRVVLPMDYQQLLTLLSYFARLISYHVQETGDMPRFESTSPPGTPTWNPSMFYAYLVAIYGGRLARLGALPSSESFLVMSEYLVPTFIAKHLQQISTSNHMGREVVCQVKQNLQAFLQTDCGTGGLGYQGAMQSAPCYVDIVGDTEGWFSVGGPSGQPSITPDSLSTTQLNKLSAVISRCFKHTVKVSDIPLKASNNELKVTPVSSDTNGQLIYSCLDDKTMCDLLLPLASMNTNSLLNSPNPLQAAAPIRCDGSLVMCPEAKISFLFWLANKHPFVPGDSFIYYLRKFGVRDQHLANLQLNIRQVNWQSFASLVAIYCTTLTDMDQKGYWYLYNYLASIIWANIPGCFRAFSPISQGWGLSKQFPNQSGNPGYCAFAKNPRIPPFVQNVIHMLREPIRSANQITFFYGQSNEDGALPFWEIVATNAQGSFNGQYGEEPVTVNHSNLSWNNGPYFPYANFTSGNPSGVSDPVRNLFCLRNIGPSGPYLQKNLLAPVSNQNIYNQWGTKGVKLMKRSGRYYIPSSSGPRQNYPPSQSTGFQYYPVIPRLISSWEPCGYVSALLSLANQLSYYLPSEPSLPLVPTFSSLPAVGAEDAAVAVIQASNTGQGSTQQVAVGKATNTEEAQAIISAEAAQGAFADQSTPVPESMQDKVAQKGHDLVHGLAAQGTEKIITEGGKIVKGAGKAALKTIGLLA